MSSKNGCSNLKMRTEVWKWEVNFEEVLWRTEYAEDGNHPNITDNWIHHLEFRQDGISPHMDSWIFAWRNEISGTNSEFCTWIWIFEMEFGSLDLNLVSQCSFLTSPIFRLNPQSSILNPGANYLNGSNSDCIRILTLFQEQFWSSYGLFSVRYTRYRSG